MRRVSFYVDGFNLYYGSLKANPALKWLDLEALARVLRPKTIVRIRYFTARVRPIPDPQAPGRQKLYLAALGTLPSVTVHFGRFRTHPVRMAIVNPAPRTPATALVHKTEEKGSDVNLATYLLLDGFDHAYGEAVVISGDSDLVEPIKHANARFGPVHVLNPRGLYSDLAGAAASYGQLPFGLLAHCQLPASIKLPSGRTIHRPSTWT
jgi:uncharacterized LabA/DUF88 family protein